MSKRARPVVPTRAATEDERRKAAMALMSLEIERNVIALVPAPDPHFDNHKIRVQVESNPAWYRDFLAGRWDRRGCQVKRGRIVRALKRVAERGVVRNNGYEKRLLEILP